MRLAIYATNEFPYPVPPGAIQAALGIAGQIADGVAASGHSVEFFCAQESVTKAHKRSLGYRALTQLPMYRRLPSGAVRDEYIFFYSQRMVCAMVAYLQQQPVDLIHLHNVREALPVMQLLPHIPKVVTIHDNLFTDRHRFFLSQCQKIPNTYFISISRRQRAGLPTLPFFANVYNGIDTDRFRFHAEPDNDVMFSGRLIPEKGVDVALRAAKQAGSRILVAGLPEPRQNISATFTAVVNRMLRDRSVEYRGRLQPASLVRAYGKARALLVPIQWEEPFGLVMIEAMACGTPVIAFKRGAVSEIVRDGKTGFIVRTLPEMVRALKKIDTLKRQDCRDHVLKHFSVSTMVANYLSVYKNVLTQRRRS